MLQHSTISIYVFEPISKDDDKKVGWGVKWLAPLISHPLFMSALMSADEYRVLRVFWPTSVRDQARKYFLWAESLNGIINSSLDDDVGPVEWVDRVAGHPLISTISVSYWISLLPPKEKEEENRPIFYFFIFQY